jgi:hypothetical protein
MNLKWAYDKSNDRRASIATTPAVATPSITAAAIACARIAAAVIPGMAVPAEPTVIAAFAAGITAAG